VRSGGRRIGIAQYLSDGLGCAGIGPTRIDLGVADHADDPPEVDGWDMAGTVDDTSGMAQWEASNARSGYRVRWPMANGTTCRISR
jgi:hypothetical protein